MSSTLLINPTAMEAGLLAAANARAMSQPQSAAFEAFAKTGMPHRRMEAWKWTDLRQALREDVTKAAPENDVIAPSVFGGVGAYELTIMNGAAEWSGDAPEGIAISNAPADARPPKNAADHPLANLVCAFAGDVLRIEIAAGAKVDKPILLRRIAGPGTAHAHAVLTLGKGASATLIESFDGVGAYFSNSLVDADVAEGASLTRIVLQDGSDDGVEASLWSARLRDKASLRQTALLLGAKAVRLETQLSCDGEETDVSLDSAAAISGSRHADLTARIDHGAERGVSRQRHKAVLRDASRGVFQGKFHVARGAQHADAQMKAQALLLSDRAEANHKPELEIYADDVQCAHGSTVGALDDSALFYMRQRGLTENEARSLLIEAFVGEIFDAIAHVGVREVLHHRLLHWLGGSK